MTWDVLCDQRPLGGIVKTAMKPVDVYNIGSHTLAAGLGAAGANKAQGMLDAAGADRDMRAKADVGMVGSGLGGLGREIVHGLAGGGVGALGGALVGAALGHAGTGMYLGAMGGAVLGGAYGTYRGYRAPIERAQAVIDARDARLHRTQKTASLDPSKYQTAANVYSVGSSALAAGLGAAGANKAQGMLDAAGADRDMRAKADVGMAGGAVGGFGREIGYGFGGAGLGALGGGLVGAALGHARTGAYLGATGGAMLGGAYGTYRGYRAPIERAQAVIDARDAQLHRTQKTAGLFMRPSEIGDHRKLAMLLEERLNGAAQGTQFKPAEKTRMLKMAAAPTLSTRVIDAGTGAFGGLVATNRLMNRTLSEDSPIPPPQEPDGLVGRFRAARDRLLDHGTRSAREYPVTAHLLGAGTGALALHMAQPRIKERAYSIMRRVG